MKYKVGRNELKECINEAIKSVLMEDMYDDIIAQAMSMSPSAQKAAMADMGAEEDDDETDYEDFDNEAPVGYDEMSDEELTALTNDNDPSTAKYRNAASILKQRKDLARDKKDILSGELVCPVGYKIVKDANGKPVDVVPAYKNFGKDSGGNAFNASDMRGYQQSRWGGGVSND